MKLTVILTNYVRPKNINAILDSLSSQSIQHSVFVWDNSPNGDFDWSRADWVVTSSRNMMCGPRWWMAAQAETPWVLIMDDDLMPSDTDVLADVIRSLERHDPSAVGAAGVKLVGPLEYNQCEHIGIECHRIFEDVQVDVLKGRFVAVSTERVRRIGFLDARDEDDIAVSAALGGGVVLAWLQDRMMDFPTGDEALWRRARHYELRESARRTHFS